MEYKIGERTFMERFLDGGVENHRFFLGEDGANPERISYEVKRISRDPSDPTRTVLIEVQAYDFYGKPINFDDLTRA